jgi:Cu/Ag efflux protein CusF
MKKIVCISSVVALLGLAIAHGLAQDQQESQKPPMKVVSETNVVTATVEDIDMEKREVTLKNDEGKKVKLKVRDNVRLEKVKKGDKITAGYYKSAAIALNKAGETPAESGQKEAIVTSKTGDKPGGMAVKTTQVTATVEEVDYPKREVKLKDSEGNTVELKVDDRVKNLEQVKKGDQIVARYTEAFAVSVKPEE